MDEAKESELDKTPSTSDSASTLSLQTAMAPVHNSPDIEKIATTNTRGSQNAQPAHRTATAQDWNGPDDPENPHNWKMWKRLYHTISVGLFCFTM